MLSVVTACAAYEVYKSTFCTNNFQASALKKNQWDMVSYDCLMHILYKAKLGSESWFI